MMTPCQLAQIMRARKWTRKGLARLIQCHPDIVSHWLSGERNGHSATIAPVVAEWLEAVAAGEDRPPPTPEAWKRRLPVSRRKQR